MEEHIERIPHNLDDTRFGDYNLNSQKKAKTMNLTYPHMDKSEEERHASPNASHGNYIVVHTGSTYRESTVVVRSELKPRIRKHKDRHCYDSSVPYVYVVD